MLVIAGLICGQAILRSSVLPEHKRRCPFHWTEADNPFFGSTNHRLPDSAVVSAGCMVPYAHTQPLGSRSPSLVR